MKWIIGDVHGCISTLQKLLDSVFQADNSPEFVFVGDYVDRGLHSKQTVDLLLNLQTTHTCDFLRGNHDDVVDFFLNGICKSNDYWTKQPPSQSVLWWCQNGFIPTLISYGFNPDNIMAVDIIDRWRELVPESHKKFFRNLPLFWENDTHFACHAYMSPNEELPRKLSFIKNDRNDETLWSRFRKTDLGSLDVKTPIPWDKIGVFGHTPTTYYGSPVPVRFDQIRLIDTGSFLGGYLTAYCCETDDWILQATVSSDIPPKN